MSDGAAQAPVLQPRCVHCGFEIPGPAVLAFSSRVARCPQCGRLAPEFATVGEYRRALAQVSAVEAPRVVRRLGGRRW